MLQVPVIRDQQEKVLVGLKKRNFKDAEALIEQILDTDQRRRETQKAVDDIKAQSNSDSKKIGELMKAGKAEEATLLRTTVASDRLNSPNYKKNNLSFYTKFLMFPMKRFLPA